MPLSFENTVDNSSSGGTNWSSSDCSLSLPLSKTIQPSLNGLGSEDLRRKNKWPTFHANQTNQPPSTASLHINQHRTLPNQKSRLSNAVSTATKASFVGAP